MVNFVTPSRYDRTLADKGISVAVDEGDTYYGTFDVKCYDPYSPFFKVARERYLRNQKAVIKALKDDQTKSIHQFVHMAMFGWKDIMGEDGPVSFSKDNAFAFLTQTEIGLFVFGELIMQASDVNNFKAADVDAPEEDGDEVDPIKSKDEVAGN